MIAIVDYGVGNLFSLSSSFKAIGADTVITGDEKEIAAADKILLPGVGAFADASEKLKASGLDNFLTSQAKSGKPIMGICLGMQLLFEKSHEYGTHRGLGLLEGEIVPIKGSVPESLKIPHIGWNALHIVKKSPLLKYTKENSFVYFVHSYYAECPDDSLVATTEYGKELTAIVRKGNVFGCQFHPEKSGDAGLSILRAFCEMEN